MGRFALTVLHGVAALGLGGEALAKSDPAEQRTVAFVISDCEPPELNPDAIRDALAIELAGAVVQRLHGTVPPLPRLEVHLTSRCSGGAGVSVSALDRSSGASTRRDIALEAVPPLDRPRVIALVAGELLESLGYERSVSEASSPSGAAGLVQPPESEAPHEPAPSPSRAEPAPSPSRAEPALEGITPRALPSGAPMVTSAARGARSLEVALLAKVRAVWGTPRSTLLGVGAGLSLHRVHLDLETLVSSARAEAGTAFIGLASVSLAYDPIELDAGPATLHGGLAAGAGLSWASAESTSVNVRARNALGFYGDFKARARLELPSSSDLRARVALELGRAAGLAALADDVPVVATGGWFAAAGAGVVF